MRRQVSGRRQRGREGSQLKQAVADPIQLLELASCQLLLVGITSRFILRYLSGLLASLRVFSEVVNSHSVVNCLTGLYLAFISSYYVSIEVLLWQASISYF
jgi:hypothetical protein